MGLSNASGTVCYVNALLQTLAPCNTLYAHLDEAYTRCVIRAATCAHALRNEHTSHSTPRGARPEKTRGTQSEGLESKQTDGSNQTEQDINRKQTEQDIIRNQTEQDVNQNQTEQDVNQNQPEQDVNQNQPEQDVNQNQAEQDYNSKQREQDVKEKQAAHDGSAARSDSVEQRSAQEERRPNGSVRGVGAGVKREQLCRQAASIVLPMRDILGSMSFSSFLLGAPF